VDVWTLLSFPRIGRIVVYQSESRVFCLLAAAAGLFLKSGGEKKCLTPAVLGVL
jgi:hypothetical protein